MDRYSKMFKMADNELKGQPVNRDVYVADLDMTVNTDLETADEINYAAKTQVLEKPKQEYMGLKECENPFKSVFNASVESFKTVLDKVIPESIKKPAKEWAKGAVATGVSLGNLSWGATKIFSGEFAMGGETLKQKRELEQSFMKKEISQEEYSQRLKELLSKREKENVLMREDIAKEVKANNEELNKWLVDMGFGPDNDSKAGKFFYNLGSANVSMAFSLGAFALTKNPMLSIALLSTPEFTSGYLQAIEQGKSADEAMKSGAENFLWVAGTEFIGTKVLFSTLSKSSKLNDSAKKLFLNSPRLSMTTVAGLEEGTQEAIQSVGTELLYKFNDISDVKAVDIIKKASSDFFFAFLSGGMIGAVMSNIQYENIVKDTKTQLLNLKDSKGQKLYSPEQAEAIAQQTANIAMSNELMEEVTGISRNERENSLSKEARNPKTIKKELEENLKKMETALPEIRKELMDIKGKVKDNALSVGLDDNQATMVAEMTQARALLYYNAFGITPLQFYYLNELEIRVDEKSNILSNGRETGYTVRFDEGKVFQALSDGNITKIIQSIRTKENLDKFGIFVNKLVSEGRITEEQRSFVYSQLAERLNELPNIEQVVDKVREEEVDKFNQAIEINPEANIVDLTGVFEDLKGNEKEIKKIAEKRLNEIINLPLETATAPLQIQVIKDNIRPYNLKTENKIKGTKNRVHKASLSALEKVVKNAVKVGKGEVSLHNTSKKTIEHKKKVEQYIYFKSPIKIKIGEEYFYYDVKLITEQIKGQSKDLLDLYHIEIGKPRSTSRRTNSSEANINITQNNENVNIDNSVRQRLENRIRNPIEETEQKLPSNVGNENFELVKGNIYKINNASYWIYSGQEKDGLLGFIGSNGNIEYLSPNNLIVDVSQNYPQNNQNNNRGELIPKPIDTPIDQQSKSIITVFSGGDRSTVIHELAHIFLRDIEIIENQGGMQDEQFKKIKNTLDKWLGKKKGQKYTVEQQEKFASGFETYMATGQAPKPELKTVFDYFKSWMSQIYNGIRNMIAIPEDVKNMFDDILTLQPMEQTPQTQTEGGNGGNGNDNNIVPVTPNAKDLGKIENKKGFLESAKKLITDTIEPISTKLGAIDVRLEYEMKMFEARLSRRSAIYKNTSMKFLEETEKLKEQNKQDYLNFDRALKNGDIYTINRIAAKYPELKKAYEAVREMLDGIKADLKIYGVGALENYFPRRVANVDGLVSYLEGTDKWSLIERAMKQQDPDYKKWSEEKKSEFIASWLNGYGQTVSKSTSNVKERKIETVTDEMDRYYKNSAEALLDYINDISSFLETARLLKVGKDEIYEMAETPTGKKSHSKQVSTEINADIAENPYIDLKKVIQNIDSILATHIKDLVKDKAITREQEREIRELLRARFNFQNTNTVVSMLKSLGYLMTLGSFTATVTQFGDLAYSVDNVGFFNTLKAVFGKKEILLKELGIDHPAEDIKDNVKIMDKFIKSIFKGTGFTLIDKLGKTTYITTTFMKYKDMIEKDEKKAFDDISRRYGDDFAKEVIHDIKNNIISENIYYFAHCELARVQPISLSELPKEYLQHPVWRIAYSLKTFWVKQFNRIITDNKRLIQEGIKENNVNKVKDGMLSMTKLILLSIAFGAGSDMLKDLFLLRTIDFDETFLDNFLKLFGISRYTMYKARDNGLFNTAGDLIINIPVLQIIDDFTKELPKVAKGKLKVKDMKIWGKMPGTGQPYYWWLGGGRLKEKKKNNKRKGSAH